jgi:DNA (cytosine-5)-methyltransferase 1
MGYYRAGFDVVGVDIKPQPRYPFQFIQADAMTFPLDGYDAIHASPPCQAYSSLKSMLKNPEEHPELIDATRDRLVDSGVPWVIENVMGAPLRNHVVLCGEMFGLRTVRHRKFETPFLILQPQHPIGHKAPTSMKTRRKQFDAGMHISVTGDVGSWVGPACMGIDWMLGDELSQAIPPAYTEYIGIQLMIAVIKSTPSGPATPWHLACRHLCES